MTLSRKSLLDYIIEALKPENLKLKSRVDSLGENLLNQIFQGMGCTLCQRAGGNSVQIGNSCICRELNLALVLPVGAGRELNAHVPSNKNRTMS